MYEQVLFDIGQKLSPKKARNKARIIRDFLREGKRVEKIAQITSFDLKYVKKINRQFKVWQIKHPIMGEKIIVNEDEATFIRRTQRFIYFANSSGMLDNKKIGEYYEENNVS